MFDKVFISDPNFQFTQYFTFENVFLFFLFLITVGAIFALIPDLFSDQNL